MLKGVTMLSSFLKKCISLPITLFILCAITFFMVRIAPGSPFSSERDLDPVAEKAIMAEFHLDKPLSTQFFIYIKNVSRGDFGPSMKQPSISVRQIIAEHLPHSLWLGLCSLTLATILGVIIGSFAALKHLSLLDLGSMSLSVLGLSLPAFVIGPLLQYTFTLLLQVLPTAGYAGPLGINYLVLPIITLALPFMARIARLTRSSTLDVLDQNYVKTAKAKGLPFRRIITKHVLKGALLPVVTYLGPALAGVTTGTLVVEKIFQIPGLGREFVESALNRDYTLVMGTVLTYGCFLIVCNALSDLAAAWINPRLRDEL